MMDDRRCRDARECRDMVVRYFFTRRGSRSGGTDSASFTFLQISLQDVEVGYQVFLRGDKTLSMILRSTIPRAAPLLLGCVLLYSRQFSVLCRPYRLRLARTSTWLDAGRQPLCSNIRPRRYTPSSPHVRCSRSIGIHSNWGARKQPRGIYPTLLRPRPRTVTSAPVYICRVFSFPPG